MPPPIALTDEVTAIVAERGLIPLVDIAYQGFGRGLDEDARGMRGMLAACDEVLVAVGDTVTKDQGLVTLESDKATMEVPSPAAGVITAILLTKLL